ncbi:hypothetical protein EVAR_82005_1 [Eumeta japonica]|uniref:Uncharacterized protein n=1 Tax=Eumeta variegata TaxID=151549 RepID=A0A4C1VXJ9_EUMVA|nr:hypothetical protein EVAR_82005_1 [Eumeta japonica]
MLANADGRKNIVLKEDGTPMREHNGRGISDLDVICQNLSEVCSSFQKVFKLQESPFHDMSIKTKICKSRTDLLVHLLLPLLLLPTAAASI